MGPSITTNIECYFNHSLDAIRVHGVLGPKAIPFDSLVHHVKWGPEVQYQQPTPDGPRLFRLPVETKFMLVPGHALMIGSAAP